MVVNLQLWFCQILYSMFFKWQSLSARAFFGQTLVEYRSNSRFMANGLLGQANDNVYIYMT